ncbi:MAG: hypothetical protein HYV63_11445 [Candidatus Schekmanbacteria bacterium]|nr:hypothetical protein [Candidatus Schekmanbacteria bacterium]
MTTASISLMPEITARVRPPRALAVPFPLGFPLGRPHDAAEQKRVLRNLLALCERRDVPVLERLDAAEVSGEQGEAEGVFDPVPSL